MNAETPIVKRGERARHATLAGQLARYGVVGLGVTLLGAAIYWFCAAPLGIVPLAANLIAYLVMVSLGYVLHSRYSFRGHGARGDTSRLADALDGLHVLDVRGRDDLGAVVEHVLGAGDGAGHVAHRAHDALREGATGRAVGE